MSIICLVRHGDRLAPIITRNCKILLVTKKTNTIPLCLNWAPTEILKHKGPIPELDYTSPMPHCIQNTFLIESTLGINLHGV
jgi:hypothetical protein